MADTGNGEENETVDNTMNGEVKDVEDADTTSNGADEPNYNAYLSSGCYPKKMKDLKSNLRKHPKLVRAHKYLEHVEISLILLCENGLFK